MLCVTSTMVIPSSLLILSANCMTTCDDFGSNAAVGSSIKRISVLSITPINKVSACRWPPDRLPMGCSNLFSSPIPRLATFSSTVLRNPSLIPMLNFFFPALREANLKFSNMLNSGAVPCAGF